MKSPEIVIGKRKIGSKHPPFVIAEVGINHEGSVAKAVEWVKGLTHEVKIGEEFEGEVKRMLPF